MWKIIAAYSTSEIHARVGFYDLETNRIAGLSVTGSISATVGFEMIQLIQSSPPSDLRCIFRSKDFRFLGDSVQRMLKKLLENTESLEHYGGLLKKLRREFQTTPNEERKAHKIQNALNRRCKSFRESLPTAKKRRRAKTDDASSAKRQKTYAMFKIPTNSKLYTGITENVTSFK